MHFNISGLSIQKGMDLNLKKLNILKASRDLLTTDKKNFLFYIIGDMIYLAMSMIYMCHLRNRLI